MHSVKEKIIKVEYRNWVKSTLGLERTNHALYEYVKEKFSLFTHYRVDPCKHFTQDEYDHVYTGQSCIRTGLTNKIKYRTKTQVWEWNNNCEICQRVFGKILRLHSHPKEKGIHWKNSNDTSNITLDWAIAKMFMPEGNDKNTGPWDTDISATISIMLNCKLFTNPIRPYNSKELRKARNDLFHSPDNLIICSQMETYFDSMSRVLADASNDRKVDMDIRETIKADIDTIKKLKQAEMTIAMIDDALKIKRKGINDDFVKCLSNNKTDELKPFLQLVENNATDLQYMNDHIDEIYPIRNRVNFLPFNQEMRQLKMSLCLFWQAIRDSAYALDAEGMVIIVILAIGLALLLRFVLLFA